MEACSIERCDKEVFEKGKCIFHCKKDNWYAIDKDGKKDWSKSEEKVRNFWEGIREKENPFIGINWYIFPITDLHFLLKEWKRNKTSLKEYYFDFGWQNRKPLEIDTGFVTNCIFLDEVNFNERIKIENGLIFQNVKFYGGFSIYFENTDKVAFTEVDFSNVSLGFWRDIDKIKESDSVFLNKEGKLYDEIILFENGADEDKKLSKYREVERLYLRLQKNFAKKGEIAESVKYAKGKVRVAEARIKKFNQDKFDSYEQREFLYAEMKKRYDDLSLYAQAEDFFVKEMDAKLKKLHFKSIVWFDFDKTILVLYRCFSNYNTSPLRTVLWIIGITIFFYVNYYLYFNMSSFNAFLYSIRNSLPFFGDVSKLQKPLIDNHDLLLTNYPDAVHRGVDVSY